MTTGAFTAAALLSYMFAPDWMWMYLVDPQDVHAVVKLIPIAYVATFVAAFAAAARLRRDARAPLLAAAGACIAVELGLVAATWDRYRKVGTRDQWQRGEAADLFALKPQGLAKKISALAPLVAGSFALGLYVARRT